MAKRRTPRKAVPVATVVAPVTPSLNTTQKFKVGDYVSMIHYTKVGNVATNKLGVEDIDLGMSFDIEGSELLNHTKSASYFSETKKVTRTELAELLMRSFNVPFTVNFVKQNGEVRTLVGRLIEPEPVMGRSRVVDFEDNAAPLGKQVDHRTLNWMIVNGTKYEVRR